MRSRMVVALGILAILAGAWGIWESDQDFADVHVAASDRYELHIPLYQGITVGQTVRAEHDNLSAIGIPLAPYTQKQPSGRVILHVKTAPDASEDLRTATVPAQFIRRDVEERFSFSPIPDAKGKTFFFSIEFPDGLADQAIGVLTRPPDDEVGEDHPGGTLYRDGQPSEGDLSFTLYQRERPLFGIQLFAGLVIAGLSTIVFSLWGKKHALAVGVAGLIALWHLPLFIHAGRFMERWHTPSVASFSGNTAGLLTFGAVVFLNAIGCIGMYIFLRRQRASVAAAIAGSTVFAWSSFFSLHTADGSLSALSTAAFPWIAIASTNRLRERWAWVLLGLATGILLSTAGPAFTLLSLFLLGPLLFFGRTPPLPRTGRIALGVLGLVLFVLTVMTPTLSQATQSDALPSVRDVFFDPRQITVLEKFPDQALPWTEYGGYIGIFAPFFTLLALVRAPRRFAPLAIPGVLVALMLFIPQIHSMMTSWSTHGDVVSVQRLLSILLFSVGVGTALGLDTLRRLTHSSWTSSVRLGQWMRRWAFAGIALVIASDLLHVSSETFSAALRDERSSMITPLQSSLGNVFGALLLLASSIGAIVLLWTRRRSSGMLHPFRRSS